jgi:hypothetical protein
MQMRIQRRLLAGVMAVAAGWGAAGILAQAPADPAASILVAHKACQT